MKYPLMGFLKCMRKWSEKIANFMSRFNVNCKGSPALPKNEMQFFREFNS